MRELKIFLVVILGMALGFLAGFVVPLVFCFVYDAITNPSPGSGMMTVGWVFCFVTIPVFTITGGFWFRKIAIKRMPENN